jgi:hypothetical protein
VLHLTIDGGVARLTFDNPSRLNAINEAMWRSFPEILAQVRAIFDGLGPSRARMASMASPPKNGSRAS